MKKTRLAIVGCKNMGTKHFNILKEHFNDEVEVVGILNSTPQSSMAKAHELGVPFFNDIAEITKENVDAVIISTPATSHCEIGKQILSRGISCLMEKPMASNVEECDELLKTAKDNKAFLMVGHTENYNPAVIKLKEVLKDDISEISGIRISKNAGIKRDISVIPELMIHDLAIVMDLIPSRPTKIKNTTKEGKDQTEHALVELEYENGAKVKLEALIDFVPVEKFMSITDKSGNKYLIEFMDRRLSKNGNILIEGGVSLKEELADFIASHNAKKSPEISAERAKDIVEMCCFMQK